MEQNPAAKLIMDEEARADLLRRLYDQGIPVRHTRLHGTQMLVNPRDGWEPFSFDRARQVLSTLEEPSKLDIANARMREE